MNKNRSFITGSFYHIYNRGVAKQIIFNDNADFQQFSNTLSFYLEESPESGLSSSKKKSDFIKKYLTSEPKKPIVAIHAYCLMPNHFHLLIQQLVDNGISTFLRRTQLSYTRYYNVRYERVGPLLQGTFRAIPVENDQQLLHLSRYIHLNPFVAKLSVNPHDYLWSSLSNFYKKINSRLCKPSFVLEVFNSTGEYQRFIEDYASYAQDIHELKQQLID